MNNGEVAQRVGKERPPICTMVISAGGKPMALLYRVAKGKKAQIEDVTLSVAPSGLHSRKYGADREAKR